MNPVVSVLLPVYQMERYVGQAIESVQSQTFRQWELVISDNASSDRTIEVIERFRDERIRLFRQQENMGMARNWAFVCDQGRAPLACILAADDLFEPDHLERKLNLLEGRQDALFAHGPIHVIDELGKVVRTTESEFGTVTGSRDFLEKNFHCNHVNPSAAVFRLARAKELNIRFDPRYDLMMDWHFWMMLALNSETILTDSKVTACYREHSESGSGQFRDEPQWHLNQYSVLSDLLMEHKARLQALGFDVEKMHRDLLRGHWQFAFQQLRRGRWNESRRAWRLYRRVYGAGNVIVEMPGYLRRGLGKRTQKRTRPDGKASR